MPTFRRCAALLGLTGLCAAQALSPAFDVTLRPSDPALICRARLSPALQFTAPPAGTKSLAIIFWDEQPRHLTGLWTVFDLPLGTKSLKPVPASSLTVSGGKVATNELGQPGFTAPCSAGKHNIYVDFYALDVASLNLPIGTPLQQVHAAIKRHKLLEAKAHVFLVNP